MELTTEAHWRLTLQLIIKLNSPLGIPSKATDWGAEIGVKFSFPWRP